MSTSPNSKRNAILAAARHAFLTHGYSGASMEAIAETAPVSKPTLYSHFKGKQELFAAVIGDQCEASLMTLSHIHTEQSDPVAGLKAITRALVDLIHSDESLRLYQLIIAEQQHFPELGTLVYESGPSQLHRLLSAHLRELDARNVLRIPDVNTAAHLLGGMLKGDEHFRCLLGLRPRLSEIEKESLVDAAVSLFLKGYGHDA